MSAHIFTVGPVEPFPEIAAVRQQTIPYFRTSSFSDVMLGNERGLLRLLDAPQGSVAVTLAASGTGAMEAAVANCLDPQKRTLLIEGGTFGHRFGELMAAHGIPHDTLLLPFGEALSPAHFAAFEANDYDAVALNLHETSIGQLYPIDVVAGFARRHGALLVADIIGSFLADAFSMRESAVDVAILSSQKGLCLSPGLSVVALSERAQARVPRLSKAAPYYFNFEAYLRDRPRGQTPFTPAVYVVHELQAMLGLIERAGGAAAWMGRVQRNKQRFLEAIAPLPLSLPACPGSNLLTPLLFPDTCDASEVFRYLMDRFGVYVNPCGGALAHRMLRVAHIGNLMPEDFTLLAERLDEAIRTLSH